MARIAPQQIPLPTGPTITLRNPRPDDAMAYLDFARLIMGEGEHSVTEPDELNVTEVQERQWLEGMLDAPNALILVVEHQGRLIGELNFQGRPQRRVQHIGSLAMSVHRDWRRQGIGRLLLQTLLDWATAHPVIEKVSLAVVTTNDQAIHLYKRLGFQLEGHRPREIRLRDGRYLDDYLMSKWVKPT